ncbi:MAG: hypothetical protein KBF93_18215 [Leptospiraceae bacterium]|nr:hypothetical protein [Leptospiraceae bacterium]
MLTNFLLPKVRNRAFHSNSAMSESRGLKRKTGISATIAIAGFTRICRVLANYIP